MRKSRIGTAIIWSMGLLFLTGFFYQGSFHAEWNWGILFFVVAFFGWGLQRSVGREESPPHPAVRILRSTITAIVSGLVFFFGAIFVLMCLGTDRHGKRGPDLGPGLARGAERGLQYLRPGRRGTGPACSLGPSLDLRLLCRVRLARVVLAPASGPRLENPLDPRPPAQI